MKAIQGYHLMKPEDLSWRPSNLMKIPNASRTCGMERTGRYVPHGPSTDRAASHLSKEAESA